MAESKLIYYGIIAIKSSTNPVTHHHHISHVFMIPVWNTGGGYPGQLYTKNEAIALLKTYDIYTLTWDYLTAKWLQGAKVSTETAAGTTYLRSAPDGTKRDNLTNLIDYDFFVNP